jgi:hypothetical protein
VALAFLLAAFALWWVWPRRRPPTLADPLADARALLGVPANASTQAIEAAFRQKLRCAHPDAGGSAQETRRLTEARDLLLASRPARRQ